MIYKLVSDRLLKCLQDIIGAIKCSLGQPNGIATLDDTGNVPADQLGNASGGGGTPSLQYMWVVGGANNFASLPGSPTAPGVGATTLVDSGLTNKNVRVSRTGLTQMGLNPTDGDTYYIKVKASNTLTFSSALVAGEKIIVETIPS